MYGRIAKLCSPVGTLGCRPNRNIQTGSETSAPPRVQVCGTQAVQRLKVMNVIVKVISVRIDVLPVSLALMDPVRLGGEAAEVHSIERTHTAFVHMLGEAGRSRAQESAELFAITRSSPVDTRSDHQTALLCSQVKDRTFHYCCPRSPLKLTFSSAVMAKGQVQPRPMESVSKASRCTESETRRQRMRSEQGAVQAVLKQRSICMSSNVAHLAA